MFYIFLQIKIASQKHSNALRRADYSSSYIRGKDVRGKDDYISPILRASGLLCSRYKKPIASFYN